MSSVRLNRTHHGLTKVTDATLGRRSGDRSATSAVRIQSQAWHSKLVVFVEFACSSNHPRAALDSVHKSESGTRVCFGPFLHDPYRKRNYSQAYHGARPGSKEQGRGTSAQNSPTELPQSSLVSPWAEQSITMRKGDEALSSQNQPIYVLFGIP